MRRLANMGLARGWSAWSEVYADYKRKQQLLRAAGSRKTLFCASFNMGLALQQLGKPRDALEWLMQAQRVGNEAALAATSAPAASAAAVSRTTAHAAAPIAGSTGTTPPALIMSPHTESAGASSGLRGP